MMGEQFDAARERLQAEAGGNVATGPEALSPEPIDPPEPEPAPEPVEPEGKRAVTYVVLVAIPGPDDGDRVVAAARGENPLEVVQAWGELGRVSAATKAAAWEAARDRFEAIRREGAVAQLVPTRYWREVTTRERVREPEFVPEGL